MPFRPTRLVGTAMGDPEPWKAVRENDRRFAGPPKRDQLGAMVLPVRPHFGTDEQRQIGPDLIAVATVTLHNDLDLTG